MILDPFVGGDGVLSEACILPQMLRQQYLIRSERILIHGTADTGHAGWLRHLLKKQLMLFDLNGLLIGLTDEKIEPTFSLWA